MIISGVEKTRVSATPFRAGFIMAEKIRWGILGTGKIAGKFAEGLGTLLDAELVAVGSRSQAGADAFAERFSVARRHASYEALVNDTMGDAIYVSTPHSLHA